MKAHIKIVSIFAMLLVSLMGFGCASTKAPASKVHTPVAKPVPEKEPKNDPDYIYYIYPDGTVEKQIWHRQ